MCISVLLCYFICVSLSENSFSPPVPCQITVVCRERLLQGVSGLLILAWGELWWRSLVLMSGLADGTRRAGTSLARLPPLMSSLLSIVLFRPCLPRAIQPDQTILFSFSDFSIILLNLLRSWAQAIRCRFTFPINSGAGGQYWLRIIMCGSSPIVKLKENYK